MADQSLRVVRVQVQVTDVWLGLDFGGGKSPYLYGANLNLCCIPNNATVFMSPKTDHRFPNIQNINICQLCQNVTCSCLEMCGIALQ